MSFGNCDWGYLLLLGRFWILSKQKESQKLYHGTLERASASLCHRNPPAVPGEMAPATGRTLQWEWDSTQQGVTSSRPSSSSPLPPSVARITAINTFSNCLPKQQALCLLREGEATASSLKLFMSSPRGCHKGILLSMICVCDAENFLTQKILNPSFGSNRK